MCSNIPILYQLKGLEIQVTVIYLFLYCLFKISLINFKVAHMIKSFKCLVENELEMF
jgi:hypothetical protein